MEAGYIPATMAGNAVNVPPPAVVAPPANVIRAPGLKRGKMEEAITDRTRLDNFSRFSYIVPERKLILDINIVP
ncbi:unnamed protein product [Leptidea sinapis]|uniref:Uncharacterized protein n=1 Tax=Leptidea sinapis TaxID=189913 RepID=A0A5E4QDQ8_9NEOP|nr:unnamed protein product [Leptidea sinapis]